MRLTFYPQLCTSQNVSKLTETKYKTMNYPNWLNDIPLLAGFKSSVLQTILVNSRNKDIINVIVITTFQWNIDIGTLEKVVMST